MAEPRHLEFLEELLWQLQDAEPDVRTVRQLVTEALAKELELVERSGSGVPGASGAHARGRVPGARVASQAPRSQPDVEPDVDLRLMAVEMKNAILAKWLTFGVLLEVLHKELQRYERNQPLDVRLLAAFHSLGPAQRRAVFCWWQDMKKGRSESKRQGMTPEPPPERQRRGRSRTRTRDAPLERGRDSGVPVAALDGSWSRYRPSSQAPPVSGVGGVPGVLRHKDLRWAPAAPVIEIHSMPENWQVAQDRRHRATLTLTCHQIRSEETYEFRDHDGTHPQLLAAAARHSELGDLVRAVQGFLRDEGAWVDGVRDGVPGGPGQLSGSVWGIRLMCSSGRHRSVSVAALLQVFLGRQGLPTTTTHHGLAWSKAPHDRDGCQECHKRPTVEDIKEVGRHWDA